MVGLPVRQRGCHEYLATCICRTGPVSGLGPLGAPPWDADLLTLVDAAEIAVLDLGLPNDVIGVGVVVRAVVDVLVHQLRERGVCGHNHVVVPATVPARNRRVVVAGRQDR